MKNAFSRELKRLEKSAGMIILPHNKNLPYSGTFRYNQVELKEDAIEFKKGSSVDWFSISYSTIMDIHNEDEKIAIECGSIKFIVMPLKEKIFKWKVEGKTQIDVDDLIEHINQCKTISVMYGEQSIKTGIMTSNVSIKYLDDLDEEDPDNSGEYGIRVILNQDEETYFKFCVSDSLPIKVCDEIPNSYLCLMINLEEQPFAKLMITLRY